MAETWLLKGEFYVGHFNTQDGPKQSDRMGKR